MNPIDFDLANKTLYAPPENTKAEIVPLRVYSDGEMCVSCWYPSLKERLVIIFFGKVWLWVLGGETQPPVAITVARDIWSHDEDFLTAGEEIENGKEIS